MTTDYLITSAANGAARLEVALASKHTGEQSVDIQIRQADGHAGRIRLSDDQVLALMDDFMDMSRKAKCLRELTGCMARSG